MSEYIPPKRRALKSKTGKVREGITHTKGTTHFSTECNKDAEEIAALLDAIPAPKEMVLDYIVELENFAKRQLELAGFNYENRHSKELTYTLSNGKKGNLAAAIKDNELEPEWYAYEILMQARMLRNFIKEEDLYNALRHAMLMEGAREGLNFSHYELMVLIGDEVIAKGSRSAKFTSQEKNGWLSQAKQLRGANGNLKYSDIARSIIKSNGLEEKSFQTVYKYLLANKEKM